MVHKKSKKKGTIQNVTYSYDKLNRLTAGNRSTGYSEAEISYDLSGNTQLLPAPVTGVWTFLCPTSGKC
jgi:hypothetical protein